MEALVWPSIGFYCLFSTFVFYQQLASKNFGGASQGYALALNLFALAGMIVGVSYLLYYGWTIRWWAPFVIVILSVLAAVVGVVAERLINAAWLGMLGFVAWPASAVMMFRLLP